MRYTLVSLFILCFFALTAQNLDIELRDVSVEDTADINQEVMVHARIINHGPASWVIAPNDAIMQYSLLDSVPSPIPYGNLPIDVEDLNNGPAKVLNSGDTLDYEYRLSLSTFSGGGGGKGVTVVIWPTRAASLLDTDLPNGYYVASIQTPNAFQGGTNAGNKNQNNGNGNGNSNGNGNGNGPKQRIAAESSLLVYPNPADKLIYLQFPEAGGEIRLTDLQGRIVWEQSTQLDQQLVLPLRERQWQAGLYFIQWKKGDRVLTEKVWIISR